jgi:hypothetical protein
MESPTGLSSLLPLCGSVVPRAEMTLTGAHRACAPAARALWALDAAHAAEARAAPANATLAPIKLERLAAMSVTFRVAAHRVGCVRPARLAAAPLRAIRKIAHPRT